MTINTSIKNTSNFNVNVIDVNDVIDLNINNEDLLINNNIGNIGNIGNVDNLDILDNIDTSDDTSDDTINDTIINDGSEEDIKKVKKTLLPKSNSLYMIYDEKNEIAIENQLYNYHKNKDCGYWKIAKMIIAHLNKDKNNTEFFLDCLDNELHKNNDNLENIEKVFYKNNLDLDIVYEFEGSIAKFIVENLKIIKFKPLGYIFNKDVDQNKWEFTISVITTKNIYTSNRYISENQIGYF